MHISDGVTYPCNIQQNKAEREGHRTTGMKDRSEANTLGLRPTLEVDVESLDY